MRKIISGRRSSGRGDFIMKINTATTSSAPFYPGKPSSGANQFYFPIYNGMDKMGYTVDFEIDWGDGTTSQVNSSNYATACLHDYSSTGGAGIYTVSARGSVAGFNFHPLSNVANKADGKKLVEILQWGDLKLTGGANNSSPFPTSAGVGQVFRDCTNLTTVSASDTPWFIYNIDGSLNGFGARALFDGCSSLTTINNIANWDVSSLKTMEIMFDGCTKWEYGTNANGAINLQNWDASRCARFERMFRGCEQFNTKMFTNVGANVSGGTPIKALSMFEDCISFTNQGLPLNSWDTSQFTNMFSMFNNCKLFNADITGWNTSNVTTMRLMFNDCTAFNQNINSWDVSSVTDMRQMFTDASSFDQDLRSWNVSAWSQYALGDTPLSGPSSTFTLSTSNYDSMLVAWDAYNYPAWPGGVVDFGNSTYSLTSPGNAVANARASLITKWGAINDGGGV